MPKKLWGHATLLESRSTGTRQLMLRDSKWAPPPNKPPSHPLVSSFPYLSHPHTLTSKTFHASAHITTSHTEQSMDACEYYSRVLDSQLRAYKSNPWAVTAWEGGSRTDRKRTQFVLDGRLLTFCSIAMVTT